MKFFRFSSLFLAAASCLAAALPSFSEEAELPTKEDAHFWNQTHVESLKLVPLKTVCFDSPEFVKGCAGFNFCSLEWKDGILAGEATGSDPYFRMPGQLFSPEEWGEDEQSRTLILRLTMRGENRSAGIYWTDSRHPNFTQALTATTSCNLDENEWREVDLQFEAPRRVQAWRLDPSTSPGHFEIKKIEIFEVVTEGPKLETLPMENVAGTKGRNAVGMENFPKDSQTVRIKVTSRKPESMNIRINGANETFSANESRIFSWNSDSKKMVDKCVWKVESDEFPTIHREMTIVHDVEITEEWMIQKGEDFDFCLCPKRDAAFLCRNGKKIAALTDLDLEKTPVKVVGNMLEFQISEAASLPKFHLPGTMNYAIVPGLELLEKGEWSSSRADLVIPEHKRFRPEPYLLTQTWMGIVTSDGAFRLHWENPYFQPIFAVPNYFDTTSDALLGLEVSEKAVRKEGQRVRFEFSPSTDETAFLRAGLNRQLEHSKRVAQKWEEEDLAENTEKLFSLYREQLERGAIRSEKGWGHCAGERWPKGPMGDHASALWRIGGNVPDFQFHPGGAHVRNDSIFFLRGQTERWAAIIRGGANGILSSRQPDGSWRYAGKYDVTHFESTALGRCAQPCAALLQAFAVTGDEKYLKPALETLDYCRRFKVGRGAQCWEMPLHTPDPLANAQMIRALVWAFRITGDEKYLRDAERWALEGASYVYLWDTPESPWQFGAFIGVLGATNWKVPNWIGRPVQWIGTVYAYALFELADVLPKDSEESKGWRQIAEWITLSAERQIYPEGESLGLLPDSIDFRTAMRYPADINPAVPIALRLRLLGEQDALATRWNEKHRVTSPFPIDLSEDSVRVFAPGNLAFQIYADGKVVEVGKVSETPEIQQRTILLK